jgi:general stress protein YciG
MNRDSKKGFAAMPPEKQKAIASKGGKAAHEQGKAYEFTPEKAREAGSKGGQAVAKDGAHMARIGRLGGLARGRKSAEAQKESQAE